MFGNKLLCLLLLLMGCSLQAQEAFDKARVAYENQNYIEAIKLYEGELEQNGVSQATLYNLGNAYLMNKQAPEAILQFERALVFGGSSDIQDNLKAARQQLTDEIPSFSDFFLLRMWRWAVVTISPNGWASLGLISLVFGLFLLHGSWFRNKNWQRWVWVSMVVGLVSVFVAYQGAQWIAGQQYAIVMQPSALYEGSDDRSEVVRKVGAGNKVRITDQIKDWSKVELPDKELGWMSNEMIQRID